MSAGANVPLVLPGAGPAAGTAVSWTGGRTVMTAIASAWNGATVTLQYLGPDGATAVTASATQGVFSANGAGVMDLPPARYQASVSGGSPTGLYVSLDRVPS